MKRREFITLLGSAAAAWPLAARAQQSMPTIGFLRSASLGDATLRVTEFRHGLKDTGYIEGQNVAIEYHSAENRLDRLQAMVADLIHRPVAVIVCNGIAALTAKAATTTVPIVFATGGDPVALGLVASFNRPGGNVTGVSFFTGELADKRLELLRQLVPKATTIAVLVHPNTTQTEAERRDLQVAAQAVGQQLIILDAGTDRDTRQHFQRLSSAGPLRCSSGPALSCSPSANDSSRWRLAMGCRRSIAPARPHWRVAWRATQETSRMPIANSASTPVVSSRAKSRPTCRSNSPQNSNWSSISRPLRHSASPCR
jgi:putative ABC transport system substrate-binding protein